MARFIRWRAQRSIARRLARVALSLSVGALLMTALPSVVQASPSSHVGVGPPTPCPWIYESLHHHHTAQQLAAQVAGLMTPAELASFVVLQTHSGIENFNVGVPRLCIPTLTLVDGPSGVSANAADVQTARARRNALFISILL